MQKNSSLTRREFLNQSAATLGGLYSLRGFTAAASSTQKFDFIIVGSGPGGGPLACNLARAGFKVLLMDAGGDFRKTSPLAQKIVETPALHGISTELAEISWDFYVRHYSDQKSDILYPRAATLGGCSVHNAMVRMSPGVKEWERMEALVCDSDFGPTKMAQVYKSLNNSATNPHGIPSNSVDLGLLFEDRKVRRIFDAVADSGDGRIRTLARGLISGLQDWREIFKDPNHWLDKTLVREDGVTRAVQSTTAEGLRWSVRDLIAETLALVPQNLFIQTHSLVSRILFDDSAENPRAIGVEYYPKASIYEADPRAQSADLPELKKVFTSGEVILAGGAFNSPQLLMLSGIGSPQELQEKGIPTRVALPGVGQNLQDRYEFTVVSEMNSPFQSLTECRFGETLEDPCLSKFAAERTHHMYSRNGVLLGVKKRSGASSDPDLFLFATPGDFRGYHKGWSRETTSHLNRFSWAILKGYTQNTTGEVKLKSKNPLQTPDINFKYFDDGRDLDGPDMKAMLQGVQSIRLFNAQMKKSNPDLNIKEIHPGYTMTGETELRDKISRETWGHHASCSNKMGPSNISLAQAQENQFVVDSEFRVYGTKNLRVVDASVFPYIPGLFISVPIYMISQVASEKILRGPGTRAADS